MTAPSRERTEADGQDADLLDLTLLEDRSPVVDHPDGGDRDGSQDGADRTVVAVARRVKDRLRDEQVSLLSGGVAFFLLLSLFPALAALVSVYGLIADPSEVRNQIGELISAAPDDVRQLVIDQVSRFVDTTGSGLGTALVLSVLAALWSASSGMKHLMAAIGTAHGEEEERGFVELRLTALGLTLGAIVLGAVSIAAMTVLPKLVASLGLGTVAALAVNVGVYPLLAVGFGLGLAVLYRFAPDRDEPEWRWAAPGAVVATVVWIVASIGFAVYVANFGTYGQTYGSIGAVIVLMLWLAITSFAAILGAVVDSELRAENV